MNEYITVKNIVSRVGTRNNLLLNIALIIVISIENALRCRSINAERCSPNTIMTRLVAIDNSSIKAYMLENNLCISQLLFKLVIVNTVKAGLYCHKAFAS